MPSFTLLSILDYVGTFAFAISGVRMAARKGFDLFGAFVVGFVTAVGGGTLRDLMLGVTPFWMLQPSYVVITGIALVVVSIFKDLLVRLDSAFIFFDAVGLALFTVVGLEKSLQAGNPMWVNIIMGCVTGAAGGMLRDIFINEEPLIFRKDIYAMAAIFGGMIYWVCYRYMEIPQMVIQILSAAAVLLMRMICVRFNISLPSFKPESH